MKKTRPNVFDNAICVPAFARCHASEKIIKTPAFSRSQGRSSAHVYSHTYQTEKLDKYNLYLGVPGVELERILIRVPRRRILALTHERDAKTCIALGPVLGLADRLKKKETRNISSPWASRPRQADHVKQRGKIKIKQNHLLGVALSRPEVLQFGIRGRAVTV